MKFAKYVSELLQKWQNNTESFPDGDLKAIMNKPSPIFMGNYKLLIVKHINLLENSKKKFNFFLKIYF
jgi:hypothetical protein